MSNRSFFLGVALIIGLSALLIVALAAEAAWQSLHPADPPRPQATPRAEQINCHHREPPTQSPWLAVARTDAERSRIDVLTFEWKIMQESGFQPTVTSPAGAEGIAQLMPATAQAMGVDPWNPQQALAASAHLDACRASARVCRTGAAPCGALWR